MAGERRTEISQAFRHALDDVPKDTAGWLEGKSELSKADWRLMYKVLDYIKPLREEEEGVRSRRKIEEDLGNRFARAGQEVKIADINWATTLVVEKLTYEGLVVDDQYLLVDREMRFDTGDFFRIRQGPGPFIKVYQFLKELGEKAQVDPDTIHDIDGIIKRHKISSRT